MAIALVGCYVTRQGLEREKSECILSWQEKKRMRYSATKSDGVCSICNASSRCQLVSPSTLFVGGETAAQFRLNSTK